MRQVFIEGSRIGGEVKCNDSVDMYRTRIGGAGGLVLVLQMSFAGAIMRVLRNFDSMQRSNSHRTIWRGRVAETKNF